MLIGLVKCALYCSIGAMVSQGRREELISGRLISKKEARSLWAWIFSICIESIHKPTQSCLSKIYGVAAIFQHTQLGGGQDES